MLQCFNNKQRVQVAGCNAARHARSVVLGGLKPPPAAAAAARGAHLAAGAAAPPATLDSTGCSSSISTL